MMDKPKGSMGDKEKKSMSSAYLLIERRA